MKSAKSCSTSVSLIERIRRLDEDAWRRLCEIYGPLVYHWARRQGLQDEDAADVGQEVFRVIASRINEFRREREGDTFRGWLWTITRHKLGDYFRRAAAHPQAAGGSEAFQQMEQLRAPAIDGTTPDVSAPEDHADIKTLVLRRALGVIRAEFEESTWQAFWRVTVDGQTTADIADDLGMTTQAVRQAKYRVLRRLRVELAEDLGASDGQTGFDQLS